MNKLVFKGFGIAFGMALVLFACTPKEKQLPYLGFHDVNPQTGDTIYHVIPEFAFYNQDSQLVTPATFEGKAYVADFFFTSCPTICPIVKKQMLRLHQRYGQDERLRLLSFTIDPRHDSVAVLRKYAQKLGVGTPQWHFVTGERDSIYSLADDYMSIAKENPNAPGGFDHSGWLILIDKDRHIRAYCNGTDAASVDKFMEDIDFLLEKGM